MKKHKLKVPRAKRVRLSPEEYTMYECAVDVDICRLRCQGWRFHRGPCDSTITVAYKSRNFGKGQHEARDCCGMDLFNTLAILQFFTLRNADSSVARSYEYFDEDGTHLFDIYDITLTVQP